MEIEVEKGVNKVVISQSKVSSFVMFLSHDSGAFPSSTFISTQST